VLNGDVFIIMPPKNSSWFSDVSQSVSLFFWEHSDLIPLLMAEVALAVLIFAGFFWWERRKSKQAFQAGELERMYSAEPIPWPR
jgi:hypothetical protein